MTGFAALLEAIGDGVPDTAQYRQMADMVLDVPGAAALARLDPFSPAYREAALALYLSLRGRPEQGYEPGRDEPPARPPPDDPWTGLVPWSFRDASMASEHLFAYGHVLRHLGIPPGGSVLEYGPGSGQILLTLSRLGYRACGVDIDKAALGSITQQAHHLGLAVETERAGFGDGFDGQRFDAILFYEAFHHAFDFETLLIRLHDRLRPGGRLVLCGEPVVRAPTRAIPYPWGPRLDALSVFCIRRYGWMELGFTHDYLVALARTTGWRARLHRFAPAHRASLYVLEPITSRPIVPTLRAPVSWRLRTPLRASAHALAEMRRTLRRSSAQV
ncbi:class I SAM-dependent methyltransferase [Lichenicoccus sp.]|uniref:class I SAM-dependent methyltransferase n=1 Tax=Lichenicoccus sp. TaxID=2781899 RepID=UPI003D102B77